MNKFYFKNQLLIAFVLFIFSFYEIYILRVNDLVINDKNKKEITVSEMNCGVGNGAYSITFLYNDKNYNTKILSEPCINMNIGDKYELYYSDKNDEFIDYHSFEHSKKGVVFSVLILILFLIPYKSLFNKK
ncbi:hypothetical protein [Empedobacter stercoris]|uniref:hypothetical protein n=1 Tax=Empedobacter stercoris TaxID=1628248 RepID=UPI001CE0707E|nr:hypothetical protein [Empedobacter stercoris]MCA4777776.1 hypothetical protein [Empedobacter stercoris]